jgi:hypothetical protein
LNQAEAKTESSDTESKGSEMKDIEHEDGGNKK